jgi:hypothetical protein
MAIPFLAKTIFKDNVKLVFGDGEDLQIYHDGSNSRIGDAGTGNLIISGTNLLLTDTATGENFFEGQSNGAVRLYYDGTEKFITTSTGIDVTGTVNLDNLTINGGQGSDGQVLTSTGTGIAWEAVGGTSETAERIEVTVKNVSGGSLSKGTVVHASPSANPPNGNVIEVIAADYDDSTKMPAIGILNETIANEGEGSAVMMGAVSGIDTSSFSIGDELYVGNLGTLTSTKPITAGQLIQKIAVVIKSHASNGLIKIFGAGRSNDVPLPLYIDNTNQRVGIGDSTPSYTLDVNGTIYGSGVRSGRYYGSSGTSSYLDLDSGAPYSLLASSEVNVTNSIICNDLEATEPGGVVASNGAVYGLRFYGYGNTTYYVDPNDSTTSAILNGSVGIGTTSPAEKLEVSGGAIKVTNTGGAQLILRGDSNNSGDSGNLDGIIDFLHDTGAYGYRLNTENYSGYNAFHIQDYQNSQYLSRIYIDQVGEVGIGTTSPSQKLDVSGNIKMTETAATTDTDKFVVLDSGVLKYRTGAQLRSDIGAGTSSFSGSYNDLSNKPTIPTNYLRNDAFDSGIGLYLQGGSFNAGTDTVTAPLVIDEEDFIYTKDGGYLRKLIGKTGDQIQIGQGGTSLINSINFLPGTAGNSAVKINSNTVWNAGNDGAGSGLDADLLDGQHGSYYYSSANLPTKIKAGGNGPSTENLNTVANSVSVGQLEYRGYNSSSSNKPPAVDNANGVITVGQHSGNYNAQLAFSSDGNIYWRDNPSSSFGSWRKMWDDGNDGSGSGLDADTVDGIQGSSFLRSDAADYFTGKLAAADTNIRRAGIYGIYDSYRIGHIWSMGTGYNIANNGADFGNLYGLAYKHTNNSTGGTMGGSHQMVWCNNGSPRGSIGYNSVWHTESMKAPIFYDSNNTAYYVDPGYTSFLKDVNVHGTFRFQRSATTQIGQDDNVTVTVGDSDITFTHNNDSDGDASRYNFKYTSGGSAVDILNFDSSLANFTTPYLRCTNNSTDYAQLESNTSGGVIKAVSSSNTNVLFRSYGDSYILNDLGVGISTPAARLHVDHPSTTTPVLSFGGAAGQILQSENSEFAFGLTTASPYPLYIQGRNSGNTARNINLQPAGGNIGIHKTAPSEKLHVGGTIQVDSYVRAQTFFDSNNTNYYVNPNGGSKLYQLSMFGHSINSGQVMLVPDKTSYSSGGGFTNMTYRKLNSNLSYTPETVVSFQKNTTQKGSIGMNAYGTQFNTSSDYRLKENTVLLTDGIQRVKQLQPKRFNFIGFADQTLDGFLAHEVSGIVPEAVTGEKDAVDENNDPVHQVIDQSKIVPLLTAALKEAISKIEDLETRIQILENQ